MARPRRYAPEPDYADDFGYPTPSSNRRRQSPPSYRHYDDDANLYRPSRRGVPSRSPSPPRYHGRHSRAYSPPPPPIGGASRRSRYPDPEPDISPRLREARGRRPPSPNGREMRPRRQYYDDSSDDDYRAPRRTMSRPGSRQPPPPAATAAVATRGRGRHEEYYPPSSSRYARGGYSPSPDRKGSSRQRHRSVPPKQTRPTPSRRRSSSAGGNALWGAAARTAFKAGAAAAFKERNEPGPWLGDKGAKVLSAAVGAAVVDSFMSKKYPQKKDGVRHHAMQHAAEMGLGRAFSPAMKGARDHL